MMTPSSACVELIQHWESLRLNAYQDSAGVWTIGWGHTRGVKRGNVITPRVAMDYLMEDCHDAAVQVRRMLPGVSLTQNEFDALCSFTFNLGPKPTSTLVRLLRTGDKRGAAAQFDRWIYARNAKTGKLEQLLGLTLRRAAERAMFEGRDWRVAVAKFDEQYRGS